ncbi:TrkH family potassium uptake protein [Bacillus halotolerans]|uniref:TrkH family potassium uptake protein n=1 Tax=Bacillus halotolerans TaxID=260554 RepID=UPI000D02E47B|nr:TrkH family potassium uptake protein [Bacillus halotolerans]MBV7321710.1 TrkH family potassium uptake protein [Halalkalibacterium halodurans]MCP9297259.1 TrkH family potassium uptake protein [Bacillus halotolerans]MEC3640977.1 TrkH family potassium uptake protein [Bacillus halotolerans]PRS06465.1 Ktr system potassium transporter B [Bacillus halotolerans]PRS26085.1 Ktr system potassium transporter B [Bacillus halotolerans]
MGLHKETVIKWVRFSPPQVLAIGFFLTIIIGSLLLKLPISTAKPLSWIDALFTAASATTVTGLAVVDTGTEFTVFGQTVIMGLIQVGGLGFMTFAVLIVMILGKKIGLKERMLVREALNQPTIGGVIGLVKVLFLFSISIELIAALILSIRLVPQYGWASGLFASVFHAISAFNNAGFSLWPDNLMSYVGDPAVNLVITILFITGGIGFTVLFDILKNRRFKAFSLHTKLMLAGTFVLNIAATLIIFILEYSNPGTLGSLHLPDKLWASYFQAVTPRTAGFNSVDFGSMREGTIVFVLLLMFIGAGSASTASGIKLTTFLVILMSVITYLRGHKETVIFRRTIKYPIIIKALAVSVISLFIVFIGIFALTITEQAPFIQVVFETFSAFGTVGLTMGLTPELTTAGKCIIIAIMFIGRIGPLTFVFSFAKTEKSNIRYPDGEVFTG